MLIPCKKCGNLLSFGEMEVFSCPSCGSIVRKPEFAQSPPPPNQSDSAHYNNVPPVSGASKSPLPARNTRFLFGMFLAAMCLLGIMAVQAVSMVPFFIQIESYESFFIIFLIASIVFVMVSFVISILCLVFFLVSKNARDIYTKQLFASVTKVFAIILLVLISLIFILEIASYFILINMLFEGGIAWGLEVLLLQTIATFTRELVIYGVVVGLLIAAIVKLGGYRDSAVGSSFKGMTREEKWRQKMMAGAMEKATKKKQEEDAWE